MTLLRLIKWKRLPYSVFACLIIAGYQWALNHLPFGEKDTLTLYIASSERNDLFSQNREGIFSFLGTILLDLTDERISLYISGWIGYREFGTPSETTFIAIYSIFTNLDVHLAYHLLNNIHCSISIVDGILQTDSEPSICTFLYELTDEGESPVFSMDNSTQYLFPVGISCRSDNILSISEYPLR